MNSLKPRLKVKLVLLAHTIFMHLVSRVYRAIDTNRNPCLPFLFVLRYWIYMSIDLERATRVIYRYHFYGNLVINDQWIASCFLRSIQTVSMR